MVIFEPPSLGYKQPKNTLAHSKSAIKLTIKLPVANLRQYMYSFLLMLIKYTIIV